MSNPNDPNDTKQLLSAHSVIPDVLPSSINPTYTLTITYPTTTISHPGTHLTPSATSSEPTISLSPAPSSPLKNLVLMCVDPDLMMNNDTYFGQVRHWLVTGLSSNEDGTLDFEEAVAVSPYVGPAPLPNYLYARPHRYVFIVAQGKGEGGVEVKPEDLREMQEEYAAAVKGKQEVQDIKDRWGFDAGKLVEGKGLEVLGVNFMRVGGTVGSAMSNAAMMGEGIVNKVLGK